MTTNVERFVPSVPSTVAIAVGGPERWRVISVACGGRHTMALALPDNGEVNNREVRRLTTDSGVMADFEEDEDEAYEHHGELQNGEYDDEEVEAGAMLLPHQGFSHWVSLPSFVILLLSSISMCCMLAEVQVAIQIIKRTHQADPFATSLQHNRHGGNIA